MTALPQRYTNGIQVFDWVMKKILKEQIATGIGKPFIDDPVVKPGSRSIFLDKNGVPEEVAPGIRKFVLEAIISVDRVLVDIERAGGRISGAKSEFLMEKLKVVAYICGSNARTPEDTKIQRITNWPACQTVTEIKAFIGLCVCYRVRIRDFSTIAEPLFRLMKKNEKFEWAEEQQEAMDKLKLALTQAPAIKAIDYM